MKIYTVYTAKGGCGKTTTAINLAAALTYYKKRVLLIDGDWQGNATRGLGLQPRDLEKTALPDLLLEQIYNPNNGENMFSYCVRYLEEEKFSIIPTNVHMSNEEFRYVISEPQNRTVLKDILQKQKDNYDYVIIDTPASLDGFLYLALLASDGVIIPTEMEYFSYDGLENVFHVIATHKKKTNPDLNIVGVLMNKTNKTELSKAMSELIREYAEDYNIYVFDAKIPKTSVLHDCSAEGVSIFHKSRRNSKARLAFMDLAKEIIGLDKGKEK